MFEFFHFLMEIDRKSCFSVKKEKQKQVVLTNERRAEHPFAGRNTQHSVYILPDCKGKLISTALSF